MPVARVGGRELRYEDTGGEGPPLLLLHGFPLRASLWAPQIEALGDRYRIVAPDLPGFGGSQPPEDPDNWRMGEYAAVAAGLLDHLGIEEAVVGGISMGGYIAFSMMRRHRERIRALVLVDTAPGADSQETREIRERQQQEVRETGSRPLAEKLVVRLLAPKNLADPALRAAVLALMDHPAEAYVSALEAMKRRRDSTPDLSRIDVPTLIVVGEEDVITPPSVAAAMERAIPGARRVVLPGVGHLTNFEAPLAFNEALASFMDGL